MDDEEYPSEDDTSDDGSGSGEESEEEETGDGEDDSEAEGEEEEEWTGLDGHHEDSEEAPQLSNRSETTTQAPSSRYVPPHLRNRASGEQPSEEMVKLTRQLKGLLNRLSEQNIASIIDGVEEVYRNNRRHDVTSTLTKLIIDGISSHSILLDSYVVLHAAFISAMHKLIGVEFAAYFVQQAVASYEQHLSELESSSAPNASVTENTEQVDSEVKGKETSNLIVLMSELYNFQVVSCTLIYDLIKGLLEGELTEFKVELLLKVTRNSGQQLRTDDPSALKDIVHIVHSKLPEDHKALSSRTRFMIETLSNLKNNRVKKAASQHAGNDAVERMKKFLSGLSKKRHVLAHEPLRVSLDDLHSAETKGKWWLVGAAWGGDPLVDRQQQLQNQANSSVPDSDVSAEPASESALLKLARKQGMNTDIRRSIFVVLMSSEDYVHACERLSQLKLTEVQQREIIRVILHCCGNEKAYNPYYTLIVQQLCRLSVSHKFTLQYCLWDFLRDLGETTVGGVEILKNMRDDAVSFDLKNISETRLSNLAKAYGWWIAKDCVTLAILKPVDFTVLKPQSRKFLVQLFTDTFISTQLSTPLISSDPEALPRTRNRAPLEEVFIKATKIQALALGLMYFLGEVVKHEVEDMDESGFLVWATKVALDTLRTGLDVVPNL
ncbi:MIF4G-domain-containing protein [Panus rudis PR-1116 ss-1]|nr:MIF4G-domain-containing protein [Panus rudis PR-1116 ss-1]